jgi:hypothetical protein
MLDPGAIYQIEESQNLVMITNEALLVVGLYAFVS